MQLVGMLDSPYVRRVAIALKTLSLPYDHLPLSVFRNIDEFSDINPLIKAPTLVCDNGEVLMDSTLILSYLERLANEQSAEADIRLMPQSMEAYQKALRIIGIGINACDKSVQVVYERDLRPADKQYKDWICRIQKQLITAYDLLEVYAAQADPWLLGNTLTQADITVCVAWQFTQFTSPNLIALGHYPWLSALSAKAEQLPAFAATPLAPEWKPSVPTS